MALGASAAPSAQRHLRSGANSACRAAPGHRLAALRPDTTASTARTRLILMLHSRPRPGRAADRPRHRRRDGHAPRHAGQGPPARSGPYAARWTLPHELALGRYLITMSDSGQSQRPTEGEAVAARTVRPAAPGIADTSDVTCEQCEGIAQRRAVAVPEGYLAFAARLRSWIADGILREVWSSWPLEALPESPPLPEPLLAKFAAAHWVACTGDGQLFSLQATFERAGEWSPRDADYVVSDHPAFTALRSDGQAR